MKVCLGAAVFKKIIDAAHELIDEVNFEVSSAGMIMNSMDASHVSLVHVHLAPTGFARFECEAPVLIGVHLKNLAKVLKCSSPDDTVELSMAPSVTDVLSVTFVSPGSAKHSEFELKLITLESEHLAIPDIEFQCRASLGSVEFHGICKDLSSIGDTVEIAIRPQQVSFATTGDAGTATITLREVDTTVVQPVVLTFALRYLNSFMKHSLAPTVQLGMNENLPLHVRYDLGSFGSANYYLAPKMD